MYAYIGNDGSDQSTRLVELHTTIPRLPCLVAESHEKPSALISRSSMNEHALVSTYFFGIFSMLSNTPLK